MKEKRIYHRSITKEQWTEAIKILMGTPTTSRALRYADVRKLKANLRGTFAKGMSQTQAVQIIDAMGWRIKD